MYVNMLSMFDMLNMLVCCGICRSPYLIMRSEITCVVTETTCMFLRIPISGHKSTYLRSHQTDVQCYL